MVNVVIIFHYYSIAFYLACTPNPCNNGGTCENNDGTAECTCARGFFGDTCNVPVGKYVIKWEYNKRWNLDKFNTVFMLCQYIFLNFQFSF